MDEAISTMTKRSRASERREKVVESIRNACAEVADNADAMVPHRSALLGAGPIARITIEVGFDAVANVRCEKFFDALPVMPETHQA